MPHSPGVTVSGDTITDTISVASLEAAAALIPGSFKSPDEYGFSFWPHYTGTSLAALQPNPSFSPSNGTITASVPEPATWALMLVGFGVGYSWGALMLRV